MTQSIALDALQVPENGISSQETGAKKQEREKKGEKKREKHRCEKNINQLPPTGTPTCNLSVGKHKALIISVIFVLIIVIGLVIVAIKLLPCSQCVCPDEWIGFRDHCYYFSNHERDWNSSRNYCLAEHADLTVIDDTTDVMDFLRQRKGTSDHWIGLEMKENPVGKWVNGITFNQSFQVSGNEACAYLSDDGVATARCYTERKFICRKKKNTR
ncbi:C-type lectin domain family 2 member B [Glossophaga mutica]